jgi:hypothetical protein
MEQGLTSKELFDLAFLIEKILLIGVIAFLIWLTQEFYSDERMKQLYPFTDHWLIRFATAGLAMAFSIELLSNSDIYLHKIIAYACLWVVAYYVKQHYQTYSFSNPNNNNHGNQSEIPGGSKRSGAIRSS